MAIQDEVAKSVKINANQVLIGTNFTEDITQYISGLNVDIKSTESGSPYLLSVLDPSEAHFQLLNYDGYWNNRTLTKIPIKIFTGYNNTKVEVFKGYFRLGQRQVKSNTIEVTAQDYFYVFKKNITNKEVLENFRVEQIIERACQECGVTDYEIYQTGIVIPIINLKEYNTWVDVLKLLFESTISIFTYQDGKFIFKPLFSQSETSQYTFTVHNLQDLTQTKSLDTIKNSIIIESNFKSVAPKDKLSDNLVSQVEVKNELYVIESSHPNRIQVKNYPVYKDQELVDGEFKYKTDFTVFIVTPDSPNFGQKADILDIDAENGYIYLEQGFQDGTQLSVSYKYLQLQLNSQQQRTYVIDLKEQGKNIQLLVAGYKDASQFDNGEKIIYSSVSIANSVHLVNPVEEIDNKVKFTLKNNTDSPVVLSTLMVAGNPIKAFTPIKAKFKNSTSIAQWEAENELTISNDFIVSENQAKTIGQFLYSNLNNPVEKVTLPAVHLIPYLHLGKCTVIESSTGINYDFLITNIKHDLDNAKTVVEAVKYPTLLDTEEIDWLQKDNNGDYIGSTLFNDTPLPSPSSLKVQYNGNVNGSKNIAISWVDTNDDSTPRDGYELYISIKNQSGIYTPDFENDVVLTLEPHIRGLILRDMPYKETFDDQDFFKYYGFSIRPYRVVSEGLTSTKKEYFSGDGAKTQFYVKNLPLTIPDADRVVKINQNIVSNYTADPLTGLFTFTTPPSVGTNNIEIEYKHHYPDNKLRGEIVNFYNDYKKIDEFLVYNTTGFIEDSIPEPIEKSSLSIAGMLTKGIQMNKTYDSSVRFDDFKGMRVLTTKDNQTIERFSVGQIEPGNYGVLGRNDNKEEVFRLDKDILKTNKMIAKELQITDGTDTVLIDANTKTIDFSKFTTVLGQLSAENIDTSGITASNINVTKTDNKAKININPTDGIKIQQNVSGSWVDKFYVDTNGALQAEDLTVKRLKVTDGTDNVLIDANTKTIDFSKFSTKIGKLTADNIDATNLTVSAANITGQLIASQIDSTSLIVANTSYHGVKITPSEGMVVYDSSNVKRVQVGQIATNSYGLKGFISSGAEVFKLDENGVLISGSNGRVSINGSQELIVVNDGVIDRIKIGKLNSTSYGMKAFINNAGTPLEIFRIDEDYISIYGELYVNSTTDFNGGVNFNGATNFSSTPTVGDIWNSQPVLHRGQVVTGSGTSGTVNAGQVVTINVGWSQTLTNPIMIANVHTSRPDLIKISVGSVTANGGTIYIHNGNTSGSGSWGFSYIAMSQ